jgi:hypothetical protein
MSKTFSGVQWFKIYIQTAKGFLAGFNIANFIRPQPDLSYISSRQGLYLNEKWFGNTLLVGREN